MKPFNFLGQDSGTLVNYYLDIIRTNVSIPDGYVILSGQNGEPLIFITQEAFELGERKARQAFLEHVGYQASFGGDFLGLADENTYSASITKQDIFGTIQDDPSLRVSPSGYVSGIQLDRPVYRLAVSGAVESGNLDIVPYLFIINSGTVRNILVDKSAYSFSLQGGLVSGIVPDSQSYSISFAGRTDEIYGNKLDFSLSFMGGTVSRGSVEQDIDEGDGVGLSLTFIGGSVYGPE